MQQDMRCPNCGSNAIELLGRKIVCRACGFITINKIANDESMQLILQANSYLRSGDFDQAEQILADVLSRDESNHSAHWGMFLATQGIVYVDDIDGTKRPTCLKITSADTLSSSYLLRAIELAPNEAKQFYKQQSVKINAIKAEWIAKASKEKPYDIFLCYKESDSENGIDRTVDSTIAYELYTNLTLKGYNVFFSRESLRDKTGENYEPYIYNALLTSKVMIVYGQKAEYLNATWVRNEWSRYARLLLEGAKGQNSLVVAYEEMTADELPLPLKSRQCMDASRKTFLQDLFKHIETVIRDSRVSKGISKIELFDHKVVKRASKVAIDEVVVRPLGGKQQQTDEASDQLVYENGMRYIERGMRKQAIALFSQRLNGHPDSVYAKLGLQLAQAKATNVEGIVKNINAVDVAELAQCVEKLHSTLAEQLVVAIMKSYFQANSNTMTQILKHFVQFDVTYRSQWLAEVEKELLVTPNVSMEQTDAYLRTVDSNNVDKHLFIMVRVANNWLKIGKYQQANKYANRILDIDGNNYDGYVIKFCAENAIDGLPNFGSGSKDKYNFKHLLTALGCISQEYRDQVALQLVDVMVANLSISTVKWWCENAKCVVSLLSYNNVNALVKLAYCLLTNKHFDEASNLFALALASDRNCFQAHIGKLLASTKSTCESQLIRSRQDIIDNVNYQNIINNNSMTAEQIEHCMDLILRQKQHRNGVKVVKTKQNKVNRNKTLATVLAIIVAVYSLACVWAYGSLIEFNSMADFFPCVGAVIGLIATLLVGALATYAVLSRRYKGVAVLSIFVLVLVTLPVVGILTASLFM